MNKLKIPINKRTITIALAIFFVSMFAGAISIWNTKTLKKQYNPPALPVEIEQNSPTNNQEKPLPMSKAPDAQSKTNIITVTKDDAPLHRKMTASSGIIEVLDSSTKVEVLETKILSVGGDNNSDTEAIVSKDKVIVIKGKVYKLTKGQTLIITGFDGKRYQGQVKFEKAGWVNVVLAPDEIRLRKTYDWYLVRTPAGNTGWLYGVFVQ